MHKQEYQKQYYQDNKEKLKLYQKEYHKKYPWKRVFNNIKSRCESIKAINYMDYGGRGIKCLITTEELKTLWFRDKAYKMEKPSIDRKENDGNYILENCRFIEKGENSTERNKRVCSKPVSQFDLNGKFIRDWKSARDIQRELNISQGNISKCCLGQYKQAYGFIWKYKENK